MGNKAESDRRPTCRLCLEEKPLRKSHVVSEWLYQSLYDEKHRYHFLSTVPGARRETRPTGIYERLLCEDCEQHLSRYETYARDVFIPRLQGSIGGSHSIVITGIDYAPFKLFQISLLWRASVTSRREFHRINLGRHGEQMRRMLLKGEPGEPHKYGCFLIMPNVGKDFLGDSIFPPERLPEQIDGYTFYRAVFGGLYWLYIVSNRSNRFAHPEMFLSKDGNLPIYRSSPQRGRFYEYAFLHRLAVDMKQAGMLEPPGLERDADAS